MHALLAFLQLLEEFLLEPERFFNRVQLVGKGSLLHGVLHHYVPSTASSLLACVNHHALTAVQHQPSFLPRFGALQRMT